MVMKKLSISGVVLVALLVSGTAWAGAESGFYLGGSVGSAGIDVENNNVQYDDDDTAYKIFAGYNFGVIPLLNLAIEGSYLDFGTGEGIFAGSRVETSITGWDLFGLVGVNFGPVSLFGKLGAIDWDRDSNFNFQPAADSGTDEAYGLGLQLQISSFAVRAEYEIFKLDSVDIGFASAGISYTF
jgi:hypothetical protein